MSGRGHHPAPGMMRHGPPPGIGAPAGHRHSDVGVPVAEIDNLLMENRRLAASITAMRRECAVADGEVQRHRAHIRSIETESDIQIRALLEKISKLELGLKAGESVKNDLQHAHKEAQGLVAAREELIAKIQESTQELEKWHNDIKMIPDMLSDLEDMKQEHQRLRTTFEREKRMNLDLVEHMQKMEQNLVSMNREIESLRAEIQNVEKRVQAPYGGAYPNRDAQYPALYQNSDPFYDPYRRAAMEGPTPHSNANGPSAAAGTSSDLPVPGVAGLGPYPHSNVNCPSPAAGAAPGLPVPGVACVGPYPHRNVNGPSPAAGTAPVLPVSGVAGVGLWIGAYGPNNALK